MMQGYCEIIKICGGQFSWIASILQVCWDVISIFDTYKRKYDLMVLIYLFVEHVNLWVSDAHEFHEN